MRLSQSLSRRAAFRPANDLSGRPPEARWTPVAAMAPTDEPRDSCPSAPHNWALMADVALAKGDTRAAEELIMMAYASYDAACAGEDPGTMPKEEISDIAVDSLVASGW